MPTKVILDTDIGSDIDDLIALLYIVGSPELSLTAVVAAYGDTSLRARIAHRILQWTGSNAPVVAGREQTLSGKPIWYAGYERAQAESISAPNGFTPHPIDYLTELTEQPVAQHHALAIAPLTDIASPPMRTMFDSGVIDGLTIMGGDFDSHPRIEHNITSDIDAADIAFSTDVPTTIIGLDQTLRVRLGRAQLQDSIRGLSPLAEFVQRETDRWMHLNETDYILIHDPLAAATITHPDVFSYRSGTVTVDENGRTTLAEGVGSANVVAGYDAEEIGELVLERIRSGIIRGD